MIFTQYTLSQVTLQDYKGLCLSFYDKNQRILTWQDVLYGWQSNAKFQQYFSTILETVPYPAYFWETPPLTQARQDHPFFCVVLDSPTLATVKADFSPFANYLRLSPKNTDVRVFSNLSGDAQLIAPCPVGPNPNYAHLAAFLRLAPTKLKRELWTRLAQSVLKRLDSQSGKPLWVSTSGLGVFWLHVRLDSFPKYYQYAPFKHLDGFL